MDQGGLFEIPARHRLEGLPQGGDAIWGNSTDAPDDIDGADHSHGDLIAFRAKSNDPIIGNMTADNAGTWILEHTPLTFQVSFILLRCVC